VFALDAKTGRPRWIHQGGQILHNCIAIGDGQVFIIDNEVPTKLHPSATGDTRRPQSGPSAEKRPAPRVPSRSDIRLVVALDAQTGKVRWQRPLDLTDCGATNLAIMCHDNVLVIFGVYLDGHYWRQFFAGEFASRRIIALAAEDGRTLWSQPVGFRVRPLIIGDTLHAEPWAFDLRTGVPKTRVHPVTGQTDRWQFARPGHHCGCPSASPNCLFFRSHCIGYYDLAGDSGTYHFGAQRPGCWINFIPAGGLLLVPEASSGCMCPFPNMCTVVFKPTQSTKGYSFYSAPGSITPVCRLNLNFGAAGDRKDSAGNLWLGYPRPGGSLVLPLKASVSFHKGGSFVQRNSSYTPIAGTKEPWLLASAAQGVSRVAIPLLEPADGAATYRVRLWFCDPENDEPAKRVFDVKIQGRTVLADFDIAKEAGGRNRALVKQFDNVEVTGQLAIHFVPKTADPEPQQAPIVQAIEVIRQQVTGLGCDEPRLITSNQSPGQSGRLELANYRGAPFEGSVQFEAVQGITISPKQSNIAVASGARVAVPFEVKADNTLKPGEYSLPAKILRPDGSVELLRSIHVEHLGSRARMVLVPIEDAHVSRRFPGMNKGSATVLIVDGGEKQMADLDHSLAYLKFQLSIPGKPVSVRLRLRNAGNPAGDSGRICLIEEPWSETTITYTKRPTPGAELATIGSVDEDEWIERPLRVELNGRKELSVVLDPTSCDGVDYWSRESAHAPQLIIDYEPQR